MPKLIRLSAVKEITGLSRSSIYAEQSFPRAVKLRAGGRSVGWVADEIHDWVSERIREREAK